METITSSALSIKWDKWDNWGKVHVLERQVAAVENRVRVRKGFLEDTIYSLHE